MDRKTEAIARTGYAAKGTVYGITGVLTFMAAFNLGGEKASKLEVLEFLDKQPFGNILLLILGLGLICYSIWRFIQSISDPEGIGDDKKAKVKRTAFFVSGCIYLGLAVLSIWRVFATSPSQGSGGSQTQSSFLASDTGLLILGAVGVIFICTGIYQFIRAYKNKFKKKFNFAALDEKKRKSIKNTAHFGLASRGIVFLIIGYFALQAAITSDPSEIKTTGEVFSFIEDSSYGAWLLGLVAAGFVGYAIYMFFMAKYRHFRD